MKIALAQFNFLVGDITGNMQRIIDETKKIDAELILFPELTLTSYPPEDLLFRERINIHCEEALATLQAEINDKIIIVGYPKIIHSKRYNCAGIIHRRRIIAEYQKQKLPNYGVFDEARYFSEGNQATIIEHHGIKFGILICEDVWHPEPMAHAKAAGAECMLVLNASPFDIEQQDARKKILSQRIAETGLPIFYCNLIGGQDELIFDGGSMVFDATGNCIAQAPFFSEGVLLIHCEKKNNRIVFHPSQWQSQQKNNCSISPSLVEKQYRALVLGTRDYVIKNHFKGALIGLSGGIDSALTLAIAADALGANNITAVIMPSRYTANISIEDAITECKALGVEYQLIPINTLHDEFIDTLSSLFKQYSIDTTEENIQARIRGVLLMALSNKTGKIVLTTGNKSELAVGYCTLYGDMAGGFSVIKDLYKTQVYQVAHYRNTLGDVIPARVLTRAPTAELREHQTDQDSLPPYELLDAILEKYIEGCWDAEKIIAENFDPGTVHETIRLVTQNNHKRRQAPIGIRLTKRAFGKDWRYPVTAQTR